MAHFEDYWDAARLRLHSIQESSPAKIQPLRVSRVNQLDSVLLDSELDLVLLQPFLDSLPTKAKQCKTEIEAALRYSLLRICLNRNRASHGSILENLVLSPFTSAWSLEAYAVLAVFPSYAFHKARDALLSWGYPDYPQPSFSTLLPSAHPPTATRRSRERKRLLWLLLSSSESLFSLLRLLNFIHFLLGGSYRSLLDRLLGLTYVYRQRGVARYVSFDFLNRQLVWTVFTEFLLFLLPLVNLRKLRLRLQRAVSSVFRPSSSSSDPSSSKTAEKSDERAGVGPLHHLPPKVCAICYSRASVPTDMSIADAADPTDPAKTLLRQASSIPSSSTAALKEHEATVPHLATCCGARYCYYCLVGELVQWDETTGGLDGAWPCLRCGQGVTQVVHQ